MKHIVFSLLLLQTFFAQAQSGALFTNLPVGKHTVGFKIITLTDSTRVSKPEYNYLGEKNTGNRYKKITLHLWYPAMASSNKNRLHYSDYCYAHLLSSTNEPLPDEQKTTELAARKRTVEGWFGKTTDAAWKQLLGTDMLALAEALPARGRFPLLLGMLRPLSTAITNEVLASNGYVVAMVSGDAEGSFAEAALTNIPDMQYALGYLGRQANIDVTKLGVFSFSGSGFTPLLFSMYDRRVKAVADLESGFYANELFQALSASNYYNPARLRMPFLHIFSRDLSKQEIFISEFEQKTKFSNRYRLLLNQPKLHHWDFASEGFSACKFLGNRSEQKDNIEKSFQIANRYLLQFFNAMLKAEKAAFHFLQTKPTLPGTAAELWAITVLPATKPAPSNNEFREIVQSKGVEEAVQIAKATLPGDSSSNLREKYPLNQLGYEFLGKKKWKEAIELFALNVELHPDDANLMDSLSEAYESSGDKENMKRTAQLQLDLLKKKTELSDFEKALRQNAEKRLSP